MLQGYQHISQLWQTAHADERGLRIGNDFKILLDADPNDWQHSSVKMVNGHIFAFHDGKGVTTSAPHRYSLRNRRIPANETQKIFPNCGHNIKRFGKTIAKSPVTQVAKRQGGHD